MTLLTTIWNKKPETYDPDIAYLLSIVSTWCYGDEPALGKVLARESLFGQEPEIRHYRVSNPALPVDANGFLVTFDKGVHVLGFRGTEPTQFVAALTDALVEKHVWQNDVDEWVHRGFFLSLDVLWPDIVDDLTKLEGSLYVTGHSLGGAIAVLAGRRILDSNLASPELQGVYTFGQPMVGNQKFADQSPGLNLHRHVYKQDVVAYLPPVGVGAVGYVHFGSLHVSEQADRETVWTHVANRTKEPRSCNVAEILPSFLTPLMERLQVPNVPLLATSFGLRALGLALSLSNIRDVLDIPTVMGRRLSFDDHIPTHYVDISRASRSEEAASESASKRLVADAGERVVHLAAANA